MSDIDLKLAERVMRTIADAGLARRAAMELHSTLAGDLGLESAAQRGDVATACVLRFPVTLAWDDIRAWQTVADVVRSVQRALLEDQGERSLAR